MQFYDLELKMLIADLLAVKIKAAEFGVSE